MRSALVAVLLLTGCYTGNFSWKKVKDAPAPGHFTWRNADELWGDGASVAKRTDGEWQALDVCGPYLKSHGFAGNRSSVTVGFAADGSVFALCGANLTDGQDLVRFNAAGDGVPMALPNDGAVALVQLDGDIAVVGASRVFKRDGDHFTELAAHPFEGAPKAAGRSLQEIYATGAAHNQETTMQWWNGKAWAEVAIPVAVDANKPTYRPEFRAGTIGLGPWRVEGGVPRPFVTDNPGLKRPVSFLASLPPDAALYYGVPAHGAEQSTNELHLWLARSGDSDLEYLGNGNFSAGSMYSVGGFGGYAIDDSTVLMTSTHGAVGGKISDELWEGGL